MDILYRATMSMMRKGVLLLISASLIEAFHQPLRKCQTTRLTRPLSRLYEHKEGDHHEKSSAEELAERLKEYQKLKADNYQRAQAGRGLDTQGPWYEEKWKPKIPGVSVGRGSTIPRCESFQFPDYPNTRVTTLTSLTGVAWGGIAAVVGPILGVNPLAGADLSNEAFVTGFLLALPLFFYEVVMDKYMGDSFSELYSLSVFGTKTKFPIVAALASQISLATGIGQELLFRGFLQQGVSGRWGVIPGLLLATLVSGVSNGLSFDGLFVLIAGLYLGIIYSLSGNVIVPITAHVSYNLLLLLRAHHLGKAHLEKQKEKTKGGE